MKKIVDAKWMEIVKDFVSVSCCKERVEKQSIMM